MSACGHKLVNTIQYIMLDSLHGGGTGGDKENGFTHRILLPCQILFHKKMCSLSTLIKRTLLFLMTKFNTGLFNFNTIHFLFIRTTPRLKVLV